MNRYSLLGTVLFLGLAGCLGGSSAPARFYVLTPLPRRNTEPARPELAIRLEPVELPAYLDPSAIVTRSGNRLEVAEFDRWGEPLRVGFERVLTENLAGLLGTDRITDRPLFGTAEQAVVLTVTRFDVEGGVAVLAATWTVAARESTRTRRTVHRVPVEGDGFEGMAAALSAAVGELSRAIANDIVERTPAPARRED